MELHFATQDSAQSSFHSHNGRRLLHSVAPASGTTAQPRRAIQARYRLHLAVELRDLGRLDEAVDHARQAVDGYRGLSREQPETFRPHLAHSLHRLSALLRTLDRPYPALCAAEEALRLLAPFFLQQPLTYGNWMTRIEVSYRAAALAADFEPDPALIAPIRALLRLQSEVIPETASAA